MDLAWLLSDLAEGLARDRDAVVGQRSLVQGGQLAGLASDRNTLDDGPDRAPCGRRRQGDANVGLAHLPDLLGLWLDLPVLSP